MDQHRTELATYLQGLKKGDNVIVASGREFREYPVDRVTATQVICAHLRLSRTTGKNRGTDDFYDTRIVLPTPATMAKARGFILNKWADEEFGRAFKALPLEERERIHALIQASISQAATSPSQSQAE